MNVQYVKHTYTHDSRTHARYTHHILTRISQLFERTFTMHNRSLLAFYRYFQPYVYVPFDTHVRLHLANILRRVIFANAVIHTTNLLYFCNKNSTWHAVGRHQHLYTNIRPFDVYIRRALCFKRGVNY